jgi:putative phosphoesterase
MIKIGVLSDTHIPKKTKVLPEIVLRTFKSVDHIIHAGDILSIDVIKELESLAPVTAVAGNVDPPELRKLLGEKKIISLGRFQIGVCHGHGSKSNTLGRAVECFKEDDVDCIVFGHSHTPYSAYHDNKLMFNPGSPTDKRRNKQYSFGILECSDILKAYHFYF